MKSKRKPRFNRTNENIDWARWGWNPVTGCRHGCKYCYARDIAMRFKNAFPNGFEYTYLPERLEAPVNTKPIMGAGIGGRRVFVCSMSDLFGEWVLQEQIDAFLVKVRENPQWNFLFLTKNPSRLADQAWPDNAWVGTTVDTQARVKSAQNAFANVKARVRWVSCEPMMEPIRFDSLESFNWIVIGARSRNSKLPALQPQWSWVRDLVEQARDAHCHVFMKPNLIVPEGEERLKEYPAS